MWCTNGFINRQDESVKFCDEVDSSNYHTNLPQLYFMIEPTSSVMSTETNVTRAEYKGHITQKPVFNSYLDIQSYVI